MKILIFLSAAVAVGLTAYLPYIPPTPPVPNPKSIFLHPEIVPTESQTTPPKPIDNSHYFTKTATVQHHLPQDVAPALIRQPMVSPHKPENLSKNAQQGVTSTQYHSQDALGQYSYGYATSDGQSKAEARNTYGQVVGQYSYVDPRGQRILLRYIADKDGFRAEGDHLPVPVEMPDFLKKAYAEAEERLAKAKVEADAREITRVEEKEITQEEEEIKYEQQQQQHQMEDYQKGFYPHQPGMQMYYVVQQNPPKALDVPLFKIAQPNTGYYQYSNH